MTQEEKQLLVKDICGRLLYGLMCDRFGGAREVVGINITDSKRNIIVSLSNGDYMPSEYCIEEIKPYLRPMSSMTEEDVHEIRNRLNNISIGRTITKENFEKCCDFLWFTRMSSFECVSEKMMDVVIGYLDENMFDHRGLIPMGLALEAPEDMYK